MYVATLLVLSLHYVHIVTTTVYTVTPDDHYHPNTTCHHCHNLQHYLLNITKYFTSNTQLLFLPGLHHLYTDLIIQNVYNISLIGSIANATTLDTVIQCNSSVDIVMTNITNLTLSDITVKNCKSDRHMNTAILIIECRNVQWTRVTVDSISSNGIIGINVLGDSHFSYIKSHMLNMNYNDTQSAQNGSNHTVLVDHYIAINHTKENPILKFIFLQYHYKVKLELASTNICWIHHRYYVMIEVQYTANNIYQNELIIKNCWFVHIQVHQVILCRVVPQHDQISNNVVKIEKCVFSYISSNLYGAVIRNDGIVTKIVISSCNFHSNKDLIMIKHSVPHKLQATMKGSFIHIYVANTNFSLNNVRGIVYMSAGAKMFLQGSVIFHNNTFSSYLFYQTESMFFFTGYVEISDNKCFTVIKYDGKNYNYLMLIESAIFNVSNNIFTHFVQANYLLSLLTPTCYFQYYSHRHLDIHYGNYSITFEKNIEKYTQIAYNNLPIVHCSWLPQSAYNTAMPLIVNKQYLQFINVSGHKVNILPQSTRCKILCYCNTDNNYDCYKELLDPIYPGQTITITLINHRNTYGMEAYQTDDVVVDTSLPTACVVTDPSEVKQSIKHSNCTELKYSIAFPSDNWCELYLRSSSHGIYHTDIYYITQLPCPIGFIKIKGECQCDSTLTEYNIECDVNDQTVLRPGDSWISATTHNNSYTYHISLYCPFHYCLPHSSHLTLSTPNSQCQFDRSGLLCGHCQQGLSVVFSSSYCHHCDSIYLLLIIPIASAGLLLVLLMFVLNLTVTDGTINGFILYVNIISINTSVFFPSTNQFTPTYSFVSLANLDLGIQTCFYNGMDDYAKMWLQLAFPFYLIFIAILIIITSRYSTTIQRLTARRALPVLATLFLLSYTKILCIVSSVLFSYSTITHLPSKHTKLVWSVDANVPLLGVRFILLFILCLILFLMLVSFNVILLFTRTLSRFRLINRFKPLLDAYQGPYKDKFYYWTGLQLLIRIIFFGLSSMDRDINLIASAILLASVGGICGITRPFKNKAKNYQELFLVFNLHGLCVITLQSDNSTVVNIIIILSAVHFIFIITYHIITYMFGGVIRNKIQLSVSTLTGWINRLSKKSQHQHLELQNILRDRIPEVTYNYYEFREPLVAEDY